MKLASLVLKTPYLNNKPLQKQPQPLSAHEHTVSNAHPYSLTNANKRQVWRLSGKKRQGPGSPVQYCLTTQCVPNNFPASKTTAIWLEGPETSGWTDFKLVEVDETKTETHNVYSLVKSIAPFCWPRKRFSAVWTKSLIYSSIKTVSRSFSYLTFNAVSVS